MGFHGAAGASRFAAEEKEEEEVEEEEEEDMVLPMVSSCGRFTRTYTIKDAINSRTIAIAFDHYSSAVPKIVVEGTSLRDTETCLLGDFLEHLHKRCHDENLNIIRLFASEEEEEEGELGAVRLMGWAP